MENNDHLKNDKRAHDGSYLTTNQGVRIPHTDDSLKAGERGPTIMEDFHFREKLTHFDHERIPERVVHARGSAAHGYFQVYEPLGEYTSAAFLQDPNEKVPVFVRFSTVVGFRGSADTVRDARGFATKFYTKEGNFDLVGNNIPVFFIQDGIKFPDLVHAIKPEPHHEMPQASAAHDNFWDFISLMPESMHMIMWVLSPRGVPRSYDMMEGFGVHTFRFVNAQGISRFVKFHWKPKLGIHSLVWDEAQKIAGKDPDFNRRQLWENIEAGLFPEYELGVQMIDEKDEFMFDFDILDATKIWPEELVPVKKIGKMVLNRNPDNFFAETEQVAFHPGHVVRGIDFTNDPLLQGRLFSYLDTQLIRLGGPNFAEIPVNRPIGAVNNNQRDGYMRQTIDKGSTNYFPNSLGKGCPMMAPENAGAFAHYMQKVEGQKVRTRSDSFRDFFSQATLFWNSMSENEKTHIIEAFHFELGKVQSKEVRQRMAGLIAHVDLDLAEKVAAGIGVPYDVSTGQKIKENLAQAKKAVKDTASGKKAVHKSPALSMENHKSDSIKTRVIAVLLADGFDYSAYEQVKNAFESEGARTMTVAKYLGEITSSDGRKVEADKTHNTTASVMFDATYVPGGAESIETMKRQGDVLHFIQETYKHYKPLAASDEGIELLREARLEDIRIASAEVVVDKGVVTSVHGEMEKFIAAFRESVASHRHWERQEELVPA